MKRITDVAADFDTIADALACESAHETLTPAERALLTHVPANAKHAIDVGCGDGVTTRALATRGMSVAGLDVSPRMIALARARTDPRLRIEYRHADVMTADLPERTFALVVSVAVAGRASLSPPGVALLRRLAAPITCHSEPGARLWRADEESLASRVRGLSTRRPRIPRSARNDKAARDDTIGS